MKLKHMGRILCVILIVVFLLSTPVYSQELTASSAVQNVEEDLDEYSDVVVTVEIKKIRSLEKRDPHYPAYEFIDLFSDPDFFVKVFINDQEYTSPIWHNTKYLYDLNWTATLNVPEDQEFVDIKIQLWDWNIGLNRLCDISGDYYEGIKGNKDVELTYSIKTGHWFGDDFVQHEPLLADISGYGRLNGCDDGSVYQRDRDCELWFDIYQTDPDGDNIPSWTEINVYGTDPEINNIGEDADGDGVPIEWEHKWGHYMWYNYHDDTYGHYWVYHPFVYENHSTLDVDRDGLDNVEEYLTSQW